MNTHLDTERLLRDSNPIPEPADAESLDPTATALLERILNDPAPGSRPWARRRLISYVVPRLAVVAAFAVVLGLVGITFIDSDGGSADPVTPPALVSQHAPTRTHTVKELRRLAERAERAPNEVGSGISIRVRYQTWSLFTRIDGTDVHSKVVPQRIIRTLGPDGRGTLTTEYTAEGNTRRATTPIDDGPVIPLATNVGDLTAQLASRNPSSPAGRFNAVVETLMESPAPPGARAAVLRYIARTETVRSVGRMHDRAGRAGVGFTVNSDASGLPTRYTLVFDPDSGALLDYEEMLTKDAGKLKVRVPSVIQYVLWQESTYTG